MKNKKEKIKDFGVKILKTTKAYKLLSVKADGELSPLFIDKKQKVKTGEWVHAKSVPTDGFQLRSGWHSCVKPSAPHLTEKGRQWFHIEICNYKKFKKSKTQGGIWYVSEWMKVGKPVKSKIKIN